MWLRRIAIAAVAVAFLYADVVASAFQWFLLIMSHEGDGGVGRFNVMDAFAIAVGLSWIGVILAPFLPKVQTLARLLLCAAPTIVVMILWVTVYGVVSHR